MEFNICVYVKCEPWRISFTLYARTGGYWVAMSVIRFNEAFLALQFVLQIYVLFYIVANFLFNQHPMQLHDSNTASNLWLLCRKAILAPISPLLYVYRLDAALGSCPNANFYQPALICMPSKHDYIPELFVTVSILSQSNGNFLGRPGAQDLNGIRHKRVLCAI